MGRSQQAPPQDPLLAPLLTTMGGRSLAVCRLPGLRTGSKVGPKSFVQRQPAGWLSIVALGVH
jgi:hypothetical protein